MLEKEDSDESPDEKPTLSHSGVMFRHASIYLPNVRNQSKWKRLAAQQ